MATTWLLWVPLAKRPYITEAVTMTAVMINPVHPEEEGLLLHNSGMEEYLWHPDDILGHLLLLSYLFLTVNVQA